MSTARSSTPSQSSPIHRAVSPTFRVGCVSYLNSKPLIHGLDSAPDVDLQLQVPAKLLDGLHSSAFDIALLPVIDYQRLDDALIVPTGGIASDGPTLTVRIFSRAPIEQMTELACDIESHTSVALARIILARRYGIHPRFIDLNQTTGSPQSMLLIGDKVVLDAPPEMPHQLDLGEAWKNLTGMPFVFAIWTTRAGIDLRDLPQRLLHSRLNGLAHLPEIVATHATPRGWPAPLALKYLSENLTFEITPAHLDAIRHFHTLAAAHNLIHSARPLAIY